MRTPHKIGLVLALSLISAFASAAEVAVLRNGFTIRHERRVAMGPNTRLYLTVTDEASFVDVPTAEIDRIEPDLNPPEPAPEPAAQTTPAQPAASQPTPMQPMVSTAPVQSPLGKSPIGIPEAVSQASDRYRLDPDLLNSVIRAESGFNPHAISRKGAQGLMQLMPETASKLGVPNAFDPQANVDGGTRYLRELLEKYNFDLIKALAAYNAGPQRVEQYKGVPPYRETRAYVASIVRDFNRKKLAQQKAAKAAQKTTQTASQAKPAVPGKAASQSKTSRTNSAASVKRTTPPPGN